MSRPRSGGREQFHYLSCMPPAAGPGAHEESCPACHTAVTCVHYSIETWQGGMLYEDFGSDRPRSQSRRWTSFPGRSSTGSCFPRSGWSPRDTPDGCSWKRSACRWRRSCLHASRSGHPGADAGLQRPKRPPGHEPRGRRPHHHRVRRSQPALNRAEPCKTRVTHPSGPQDGPPRPRPQPGDRRSARGSPSPEREPLVHGSGMIPGPAAWQPWVYDRLRRHGQRPCLSREEI